MISIGFVSAGGGRYYTELAREDYYLSGGESPGQWHDNGAARRFGLSGTVLRHELENLFDGYDPQGSKGLVQNAGNEKRRAALDVCFSAAQGLLDPLGRGRRRRPPAARRGLPPRCGPDAEYINDECGRTRRGQGGYDREKVDLLFAKFTHRSSRAQDPQFHCHALAINACERADGTFGTIDAGYMLSLKKTAGAYFRSALANELEMPERDPKAKFSFRIPGTPEGLSDEWSTRSKEVLAEIKEQGTDGARAKALAALSTVPQVKGHRALGELQDEWGARVRRATTSRHATWRRSSARRGRSSRPRSGRRSLTRPSRRA